MWKHKNFINLQLCATFKHFYDAGTIGTGAVKFRHYSQQEPTPPSPAYTVTFGKGIYGIEIDGTKHDDYAGTTITLQGDHVIDVYDNGADSCFKINGVEYHNYNNSVNIQNQNIEIEEIGYDHGASVTIYAK